jgi:hypothetical protein
VVNPDRVRKYLAKCEPAISSQHGHNTLLRTSRILVWDFGLSPEEAWPYVLEYNKRCEPPWSEHDLRRKLFQALIRPDHQKPRGHLLGREVSLPTIHGPLVQAEPAWPNPDLAAIEQIVSSGGSLYDLVEKSPVRFDDRESHAEEIIDVLLPGNPLLCVAKSSEVFATRRREVWRGKLATLPADGAQPDAAKIRCHSRRAMERAH